MTDICQLVKEFDSDKSDFFYLKGEKPIDIRTLLKVKNNLGESNINIVKKVGANKRRIICRFKSFNVSFCLFGGLVFVVDFEKMTDEIIIITSKVAKELNANIYSFSNGIEELFPKGIIEEAELNLYWKPKKNLIRYQKFSFGGNATWFAIKGEKEDVKAFFLIKEIEIKTWEDAIRDVNFSGGFFIFQFQNWTFLVGDLIYKFFKIKGVFTQKELVEKQVEKLIEWGAKFEDVQYFNYYGRSTYISEHFRVLKGNLVYGYSGAESYQKQFGDQNYLKSFVDFGHKSIASLWSFDPEELIYFPELENAKVEFVKK